MNNMQRPAATILLADGFSEEVIIFAAYLRESGLPVNLFSVDKPTCYSLHGIPVVASGQLSEQTATKEAALIIPGDRACTARLLATPATLNALSRALKNKAPIITLSNATESIQRRFPQLASVGNHLAQAQQPIEAIAEQFIQTYGQAKVLVSPPRQEESLPTIWHDVVTGTFWRATTQLPPLTPLEHNMLVFLSQNPEKRHTATELINATWPETLYQEGISTECLYRLVSNLRHKIEPTPRSPQHIRTWRGSPEGGYQFFPQGVAAPTQAPTGAV